MPSINDVAGKVKDSYCSTLDLADFFSQLELDSKSKNLFNFYYEDHVMSFNRAPQGWASSPFFGILALKLTFSPESKQVFLKKFKKYRKMKLFQVKQETFLSWFQDDGSITSPKVYGIESHWALLHYVFFCLQEVGLKVSTHKMGFLLKRFQTLGVEHSTDGHSIPS